MLWQEYLKKCLFQHTNMQLTMVNIKAPRFTPFTKNLNETSSTAELLIPVEITSLFLGTVLCKAIHVSMIGEFNVRKVRTDTTPFITVHCFNETGRLEETFGLTSELSVSIGKIIRKISFAGHICDGNKKLINGKI